MIMRTIHLSSGNFALVDDEDFDNLKHFTWFEHKGYAARTINYTYGGKKRTKYVSMHRSIMKTPKWLCVDHIDHNTLNNQKYNLRLCTHAENQRNIGLTSKNTSGYKGVFWSEKDKKWISILMVNGETKRLGYFKKIEDAKIAYDKACIFYHGDFAKPNI